MSYNVLNFPEPNPAGKEDSLANILSYHPVDLLLIQEMRFESGVDLILNGALNINGESRFSAADWVPQQSNPNSSHKLQQMLFYDHEKFTLHQQDIALTERRDLNYYSLYLNDPDLPNTQDTTWLDIYIIHLKSSQGSTNEQIRDNMVDSLIQHIEGLPAERNVLVAGDLNVYSSFEPAYQNLLDNGHHIPLEDPIDTPGNWNNNGTYAEVHTQSTRTSSIFNDGAGGGMDDRFDQVLLSTSLMDGSQGLTYSANSYQALGQSGDCFNGNILSCDDQQTPYDLLRSLYYMSDHLPVVLEMETPSSIGIKEPAWWDGARAHIDANGQLVVQTMLPSPGPVEIRVFNTMGQLLHHSQGHMAAGQDRLSLTIGASGMLVVEVSSDEGKQVLRTIKIAP